MKDKIATDWIRVKHLPEASETFNPNELKVKFNFNFNNRSPYDIPEAVRGDWTHPGVCRIEFRYIDGDEPAEVSRPNDHTIVFQGRYTKRISAIEITLPLKEKSTLKLQRVASNSCVDAIKSEMEKIWSDVRSNQEDSQIREVVDLTRQAFETQADTVFERMLASH